MTTPTEGPPPASPAPVTALAQALHDAAMSVSDRGAERFSRGDVQAGYRCGHSDARHAIAEMLLTHPLLTAATGGGGGPPRHRQPPQKGTATMAAVPTAELNVSEVTDLLEQAESLTQGEHSAELNKFIGDLRIAPLCRDWLKLRAAGAGDAPAPTAPAPPPRPDPLRHMQRERGPIDHGPLVAEDVPAAPIICHGGIVVQPVDAVSAPTAPAPPPRPQPHATHVVTFAGGFCKDGCGHRYPIRRIGTPPVACVVCGEFPTNGIDQFLVDTKGQFG